jgi:A/G-specific adenine glycosylase
VLWQTAADILPRTDVSRFNQALMELGALVCTPVDPNCDACPLARICVANVNSVQREIPRVKPRQQYTAVREAAVVVQRNGRVLMRQCADGERWAGLWDFPRFEISAEGPLLAQEEVATKVRAQTGVNCIAGPLLKTIKHGVTRFRITLDCYRASYKSGRPQSPARWIRTAKLTTLPLSTTGRRIACLIDSHTLSPAKQTVDRRANIGLTHERLADKNRVDTGRFEP